MLTTPTHKITPISAADLPAITAIYNSNREFLRAHLGAERLSEDWVWNEYEVTRELGFCCCKIVCSASGLTIGFLEFKLSEETYLSLLMLHKDYQNSGVGKEVLQAFEAYAKRQNSKRVRIDAVSRYSEAVTRFWRNNGYLPEKDITLYWNEKELKAVKMVKTL
jgi:GNAT superfamily N-acetyltransferase